MKARSDPQLQEVLQVVKERYGKNRAYFEETGRTELRARTLLVDPVLGALGWDVLNPDKVRLEQATNEDKGVVDNAFVDYALYVGQSVCVGVVEAKSVATSLTRTVQGQVSLYADELCSTWAVVTNGLTWRGWMNGSSEMAGRAIARGQPFLQINIASNRLEECCEQLSLISSEKWQDLSVGTEN